MDKKDIETKYPFRNLPDYYIGLLATDNGCINVPLTLRTLHRLAQDYGSHLHQCTAVTKLEPISENGRQIWRVHGRESETSDVTYLGEKIIISCGAYTNHVLTPSFDMHLNLDIWEMVASYFSLNPGPKGTIFPSTTAQS